MRYRYVLDRGSKKFPCPNCGKKTLVRFVDSETNNLYEENFGRCDREAKCGYFKKPNSNDLLLTLNNVNYVSYDFDIPQKVLNRVVVNYSKTPFFQNLLMNVKYPFDEVDLIEVFDFYKIGGVKDLNGDWQTCFPFINKGGRIKAIQTKRFDFTNHTVSTSFIHALAYGMVKQKGLDVPEWLKNYFKNDKKVTCLFGEHQLSNFPNNPVGLVEAPKSAIYSSLYFGLPKSDDDVLWLGVFNLSSLNYSKCKVLENRKVLLFPDLSKRARAYNLWQQKINKLKVQIPSSNFINSNLLELISDDLERGEGKDIADYLIDLDWRSFKLKT